MSQRSEAERRARRAAARRHHPDLGGDADEFARVMAQYDAPPERPARRPVGQAPRIRRWTRAVRRLRRELPTRLPRRWPGAKRYGHL